MDESHYQVQNRFTRFSRRTRSYHSLLGVLDATIRWISSFLSGLVQRDRLYGIYSNTILPRGGIPQGTSLIEIGATTVCDPSKQFV